ncbi:hypothetical protein A2814_02720 [Candidatus Nomurabacteria bacterium RIFCSPHIGHO2_01_FULL_38_19]|uniref:Antitoxin n=1 Tax=Candidatus Nomurabacteria bacterium RIFCSPHIGHO2_01_FULL_38_19 TaxID=1801732 RepID=A0A1F6USA6_9BACT|nr:MAG: hypothetical protein A2814_02720 [Candidatus Nomurabacteria bacterium RIFCSPHIGHO2_01_FULL_38_19]
MSMKTKNLTSIIGLKDLRLNADKYINAVASGRSFTVVRRSKPIFNIIPVDEWGDEGTWKPLVDFRSQDSKGGIHMEDFAKMLRKSINGQKRKISK